MTPNELKNLPANRAVVLKNETCPYCNCFLDASLRTKEHVIGRGFVPKGKLDGQWNLIVRACRPCNCLKSDLEDDLSAISMQPDSWGQFSNPDPQFVTEAYRKAEKSVSRRTGKQVKLSPEKQTISATLGSNATMSFGLAAPPQADLKRVFELSCLQIRAFFYWLTFNSANNRGGFWPGVFFPVNHALKSDWGNSIQVAFMKAVLNWHVRLLASGADGFFKVAIRRHPSAFCWSWSLEWNHKHRIIGFFGEQAPVEETFSRLPEPEMHPLAHSGNERFRFREEISLAEAEDQMFLNADS
jgi:hypothetical protein